MHNDIVDHKAEDNVNNDDDDSTIESSSESESEESDNEATGCEGVFIGNVDETEEDDAEDDIEAAMDAAFGKWGSGHGLTRRINFAYKFRRGSLSHRTY